MLASICKSFFVIIYSHHNNFEEEIVKEVGDADVVEFFEYAFNIPLVEYMDQQKINYKAKLFVSQIPFKDEDLDIALYSLIEQRGFSEDAQYRNDFAYSLI